MAEGAAVRYVLDKLVDPLLKKALDMYNVSDQISRMEMELSIIKDLLRGADSRRNSDESVNGWLKLVRDISYRIEDVIDTFLVEENGPKNYGMFSKLTTAVKNPIKLFTLAKELNEITHKLELIYQRRTDLGIPVFGSGSEENNHLSLRRNEPSDDVADPEIVGHEDEIRNIISHLLDTSIERRTVLSIVGIGGLGKTTVAQKVYKSVEFQANGASTSNFPQRKEKHSVDFERQPDGVGFNWQFDCRIWLSISKNFNLNDLLKKILYQIGDPMIYVLYPPAVDDERLQSAINYYLELRRYLIVLDDVWTADLWEQLKKALPDTNNSSRVIITTRLLDVATMADSDTAPYRLRCLNDDESIALLFKTAGQQQIQPTNMVDVAKRLAKKCGGLPLALVVLGGILKGRKFMYNVWDTLHENMNWHSEDGEKCSKVLAMSYDDLPYDLKPCFLYFASFTDNSNISAKHVTRMWLAEGFIPLSQNGVERVEARADDFLRELVQRCLIQVTKMSWNNNCKYCSMHDLLQEMAMHKATEGKFFTVFSKEENGNQLVARKPRRAALQLCTITEDGVYSDNTRSLVCFGFGPNSSDDNGFILLNYSGFRLLRVLSIEGVDMTSFACSEWLKNMKHLRYMGFRNCIIKPEIFKKKSFYNLETIDLKGTFIDHPWQPNQSNIVGTSRQTRQKKNKSEPADVVIPNLRHVYGHQNLEQICPLKWDNHTNLQTLKGVGQGEVPRLGISTKNLRTLGIHYTRHQPENWQALTDVLRTTEQLVSLSIVMKDYPESMVPFGSTTRLPCHERIQSLHLSGLWDFLGTIPFVPYVNIFPSNLTKLTLVHSGIKHDPMPILEKLQSLSILQLRDRSYIGTEMICSTGGFPSLEKLEFVLLWNLRDWHIQEGAMPKLSHLKIDTCINLFTLPNLQWVKTLHELLLVNCPSYWLKRRMQEEKYKIEHISAVIIRTLFFRLIVVVLLLIVGVNLALDMPHQEDLEQLVRPLRKQAGDFT